MSDSSAFHIGDDGLQSIRLIFLALITIGFLKDTLPKKLEDIPTVDVYQDDWKAQLKDQDEAWIITPLHYFPGGKRIHRKTSGGGTWNNRDQKEKNCEQATVYVRKFKFVESTNEQQATNDGTGLKNYTMMEYLPKEPKPQYALCLITVDNKKSAHDKPPSNSHQQPKIMEIDNTDANTGDKVETSQSHEPVQRGGTLQNATGNYNLPFLERILRELIKHHPFADILKVLHQIESEKLPAASPKEHSTEAPVSNTTHGRCTYTNTIDAGTSTKWQEQAKEEMFESNTDREKPTNLRCDTNRNCLEKNDEQSRIYWEQQLLSACKTDGCFKRDDIRLDKDCMQLDSELVQLAELIANGQEPNQLSHPNFNTNSTVVMDYQNRTEPYPSRSNFATTEGRLDHQMVEPNARFQEPKLYHNINGNSTEPVLNNNHLLSWNRNISAPGPSTSNYAAFMGGSDEQEFEQNVQDPCNFSANLTEPMENGWYHPLYCVPTEPPITDQSTYNAIDEQQFALCNTQHGQINELDAYAPYGPYLPLYYAPTVPPITDQGRCYAIELEQQFPLCNTQHGQMVLSWNQNISAPGPSTTNYAAFMGGSDEQMFESDACVTTEPGLDTNNNATTEPEDMDWINDMDLSD